MQRTGRIMLSLLLLAVFVTVGVAQDYSADLDALLSDYVSADDLAVVLLVSNPDVGTWIGAAGLAVVEDDTPVQPTDRFRIGSASKTFVATLILQLVEEGELALDDPLSDYVDSDIIADIANADETTIRQALNMTSGIFDYTESDAYNDAVEDDPSYAWTAAEVLTYINGETPYFPVGTGFQYSNSNYILLELVLESVTQSTLSEQLDLRIFEPLGMADSYLETADELAAGIIQGYASADGIENITLINDGMGLGDGGIISTAADLELFIRALLAGDLLEADTLDTMMDFVDDENYGLGISREPTDWGWMIGHDGATGGFQSAMYYLPDSETAVIALTNDFDSEVLGELLDEALYIVLGE